MHPREIVKTVLGAKIPVVSSGLRWAIIARQRRTYGAMPQLFPRVVTIELTNLCNAKCWMCPNPTMSRKKIFMDDALFDKIYDECKIHAENGLLKRIGFCGVGDPLLHKSFIAFSKKIDHMTDAVLLSTNAIGMDEELALCVARCFTEVSISINASNAEDYAKTMGVKPSKYAETVASVELFLETKERINSNITVSLRLTDWDETQFDAASATAELRQRYGSSVNSIKCVPGMSWAGKKVSPSKMPHLLMMDAPCGYLFEYLEIESNGDIALCCEDAEGEAFKGDFDARTSSLQDIWQHPKYVHYRNVHLKGGIDKLPLCDTCVRHYD